VLELVVTPEPAVVDATLRYYAAERDTLRAALPLAALEGAEELAAAARAGTLTAVASHADAAVALGPGPGGAPELALKFRVGDAPSVARFYVALYLDGASGPPARLLQVLAHAVRRVDVGALAGQTTRVPVLLRGQGPSATRVRVFSSHPDQLEAAPGALELPAAGGAAAELALAVRGAASGQAAYRVHLVDPATRRLVGALLVAVDRRPPAPSKAFALDVPRGEVAKRKLGYTNPYAQARTFRISTNAPEGVVAVTPPVLELPAGGSGAIGLTIDGRALPAGERELLLFICDGEERMEDCYRVVLRTA
jgi:nephrocystin-4